MGWDLGGNWCLLVTGLIDPIATTIIQGLQMYIAGDTLFDMCSPPTPCNCIAIASNYHTV